VFTETRHNLDHFTSVDCSAPSANPASAASTVRKMGEML